MKIFIYSISSHLKRCVTNATKQSPQLVYQLQRQLSSKHSFKSKLILQNQLKTFQRFNHSIMQSKQIEIPMPWGSVKAQIFGNPLNKHATPMLALHGYLDNSNSFKPIAPYLCKDEYYIISIDLPGHGLSCGLPKGIPYTPKLFLSTVRRVVKYLNLKDFILLCHSYGIMLSLLYDTVFQGEVKAILAIDLIFGMSGRKWADNSVYWKEGIDKYLEFEKQEKNNQKEQPRGELTPEIAVKILLKANKHLDEESAKTLIERGLEKDANGKFQFARDIYVKLTMSSRDHYIEMVQMLPEASKYLTAPTFCIHADPPSYGEQALNDTLKFIENINVGSRTKIELSTMKGTHHFHMIKPKETAEMFFKFLDKIKVNPTTKL